MTEEFLDRWQAPGDAFAQVVGGALRRARLRAARRAGRDRRAEERRHRRSTTSTTSSSPASHARAVKAAARAIGARPEARRRRPRRRGRQHRRRALGAAARRRPRPRRARPARSPSCCWPTAATCGCCGRPTCCRRTARRVPVRDRIAATRDDLTYAAVPDVARLPRSASRRAGRSPTARRRRRRRAPTRGSTRFVGSRDASGFVHLPPSRVSMTSGAIDQMEQVRMADVPATIATFTVDRLAFSLSPPVVAAVIDFDGGGRFQCELTDVDPASVDDRRPGRDDVPPPLHERRRAQLLLEGDGRSIRAERGDAEHGVTRDPRPGRHRRHGLHELRRALGQVDRRHAHRLVVGGARSRPASRSTTSTRSGSARWARACPGSRSAGR